MEGMEDDAGNCMTKKLMNMFGIVTVPDQILGFDAWSLDATADNAGACDVNPPKKKRKRHQLYN